MKRRDVIAAPFVIAALAGPSRDWLLATLDELADDRGPRRIGLAQVEGMHDMFRLFQEMDVMRGGGHARTSLLEYLNGYVLPLARRGGHSPDLQRALYDAAAEQCYLVGWMAYDDGQHGLAQRYLVQSLRLTQDARNAALGAHVLAGMSDQANLLGYPQEAVMLARAGRRGLPAGASPACLADLHILEARALAAVGDSHGTVQSVTRAEEAFASVAPDNEPEWAKFIDTAYLYGEAAMCFRDLGDPATTEQFADRSRTEAAKQGRARRGALSHGTLAVAALQRNDVDKAAHHATRTLELSAAVQSARTKSTLRDLTTRLKPFKQTPAVRLFEERQG